MSGVVAITSRGKQIKCKTVGQKKYVDAINKNTVVFGIGPAGTGKTYLAVCAGGQRVQGQAGGKDHPYPPCGGSGRKARLSSRRSADEGGSLPAPAIRRVAGTVRSWKRTRNIWKKASSRVAPLAYMRGRTLSNAFIILDEAQNTTKEQMKMFLTRMGDGSVKWSSRATSRRSISPRAKRAA